MWLMSNVSSNIPSSKKPFLITHSSITLWKKNLTCPNSWNVLLWMVWLWYSSSAVTQMSWSGMGCWLCGRLCICGAGSIWNISGPSSQSCCKHETALKIKLIF
jgi:hypothetical protein